MMSRLNAGFFYREGISIKRELDGFAGDFDAGTYVRTPLIDLPFIPCTPFISMNSKMEYISTEMRNQASKRDEREDVARIHFKREGCLYYLYFIFYIIKNRV